MFTGTTISELMEIADAKMLRHCGLALTGTLEIGPSVPADDPLDDLALSLSSESARLEATRESETKASTCHCGDPLHNSDEHEAVEELGRVEQQYPEFIR